MWVGFCLTINHSLLWINNNLKLSFMLGFIFGPLSYIAGRKMGVVMFPSNIYIYSTLSIVWGLSILILFWINSKINKNNHKDFLSIIFTGKFLFL